jgi:hypothetical protein
VNLDPQYHLPPGRRAYEEARKLLKAKRRWWSSKAHVRTEPGKVLQFPNKKEGD